MYICARLHNQIRKLLEELSLLFILENLDFFYKGDVYIRYISITDLPNKITRKSDDSIRRLEALFRFRI